MIIIVNLFIRCLYRYKTSHNFNDNQIDRKTKKIIKVNKVRQLRKIQQKHVKIDHLSVLCYSLKIRPLIMSRNF